MTRKIAIQSLLFCFAIIFLYSSNFVNIANSTPQYFLDQKKTVPAHQEWAREVVSKNGGTFSFRVTSKGPVAITLVTEKGYRAMMARDTNSFARQDLLLTVDSKGNTYESKATIPPGSSWFIIENQTDKDSEIRLQCFVENK